MKLWIAILLTLCCGFYGSVASVKDEKPFVIVTASYNNIKWAQENLDSVFSQKYNNFRLIYCDDCSTDGTDEFVEQYIKTKKLQRKVRLIKNKERVGPHENIYRMVHSCDPEEIICILDGDDWLAHERVLERLNKIYTDPDVWLTYGSYKRYPEGKVGSCQQLPYDVIEKNSIRDYPWVTSHLRTFYAWLYKRIKIEDLLFKGKFVPSAGDLAIMFPMVEMAGTHTHFVSEVLLTYNCANQLSFFKNPKDRALNITIDALLRHKKRYEKLKKSDLSDV